MSDASKATKIIVALTVGGLMAAFLLPIAIGAMTGPATTTATLDVGNSTELQPNMTATLDSVSTTAPESATYTITASGSTASATVEEGANGTVTVDGVEVTISVTDVQTGNATAEFEHPQTYGWGTGASALWVILPVMMVLAVFLYFTYVALQRL